MSTIAILMRPGVGRHASSKAACTSSTPKVWVRYARSSSGCSRANASAALEHPPPVQRHTGFQGQVVAQHRAHADRVAVVVGHTEVEHRAAERRRLDRVAERRDLMPDRLDHDVGLVVRRQVAHPPVAGGAHHGVDAERRADVVAVDRVDAGDVCGARGLGDIGEQQADRALADDRDVSTGQVGQLLDGVEHARQRLQPDGVLRGSARGRTAPGRYRRRRPAPSGRRSPTPSRRRGRHAGGSGGGWRSPHRRSRGSGSRPSPRHACRCRRAACPARRGSRAGRCRRCRRRGIAAGAPGRSRRSVAVRAVCRSNVNGATSR